MLSRVIISTIKTVSKLLAIHIALIWEMANKLNEGEGLELRSTDNPGDYALKQAECILTLKPSQSIINSAIVHHN